MGYIYSVLLTLNQSLETILKPPLSMGQPTATFCTSLEILLTLTGEQEIGLRLWADSLSATIPNHAAKGFSIVSTNLSKPRSTRSYTIHLAAIIPPTKTHQHDFDASSRLRSLSQTRQLSLLYRSDLICEASRLGVSPRFVEATEDDTTMCGSLFSNLETSE